MRQNTGIKEEVGHLRRGSTVLAGLVVISVLVSARFAAGHIEPGVKANKRVVHAHKLGNTGYCHLKLLQVDRGTIDIGQPKALNPMYKMFVDFYGPCDYDPLGPVEIERQKYLIRQDERVE